MSQPTIPVPEAFGCLDTDERARLEAQFLDLINQAIQRHQRAQEKNGSVMSLAGCFPYDGPAVGRDEIRHAAQQHVADRFRRQNP